MTAAPKLTNSPNNKTPRQTFSTSHSSDLRPGNVNKRVIAFFIDLVISGVISKFVKVIIIGKILHMSGSLAGLIPSLCIIAYFVWMPILIGATFGKKALGLKIVTKNHDLKVSIGSLILRETIGRTLSTLPLFLGYFWCRFNKESKTWHDMISGTKVVEYR